MRLRDVQRLEIPPSADMHVHLRQDQVMELVVPQILNGGVDTVFVMPNLLPPITTVAQALEYQARLRSIEPRVHYLMSLYLHPSITPEVIAEAAAAGIAGVKLYPQGVTTNSEAGVPADFLQAYSPVFAAMEQHDLVLNLHGEWPGPPPSGDISLEEAFLPELKKLHEKFPRLRCVLEHCSTAAAIDAVRACGPTVAGTITAHHLYLTGSDSEVDPLAFCKPIPKNPSDRDALIKAACSGDPKFFFGSDSAPHPLASKIKSQTSGQSGHAVPAGVFTQPFATQLVLFAFEQAIERGLLDADQVTQAHLEQFLSRAGRRFYKLAEHDTGKGQAKVVLQRKGATIPTSIKSADGLEIGISKAGATVFSLEWLA